MANSHNFFHSGGPRIFLERAQSVGKPWPCITRFETFELVKCNIHLKHYFLLHNSLVFWHEQISIEICLSVRKVLVRLESSNRGLCGVGMK